MKSKTMRNVGGFCTIVSACITLHLSGGNDHVKTGVFAIATIVWLAGTIVWATNGEQE